MTLVGIKQKKRFHVNSSGNRWGGGYCVYSSYSGQFVSWFRCSEDKDGCCDK